MKNTKILTVLAVLLAMGITACGSKNNSKESAPASSSSAQTSKPSSSAQQSSSDAGSSSSQDLGPLPDPSGHKWGADTDMLADAEAGAVAYKKAECSDHDGFVRLKVNQADVTYVGSAKRKSGTPDGYTKLTSDKTSMSFKFKTDKKYTGTLYFFGCMDGWSTEGNRNAGFFRNNSSSASVKINGVAVDSSAQKEKKYRDYFGEDQVDTELTSPSDHLSRDGYAPFGPVVLNEGVNELVYTRDQTQNMLIKDFVFVVEELTEWGAAQDVAANAEAGTAAYKKYVNTLNNKKFKVEVPLVDSMLGTDSVNKNDPAGYFKLKENNQYFSFKFSSDVAGYGYVYQRGVMDNWDTSNKDLHLFSGGSNGADDFKLEINTKAVDLSAQKAKIYKDEMPGEMQEGKLSPVTDVLTGVFAVQSGVNEVKYTRLASYNLALSHLIFIFEESAHTHTAAETWSHDDNYHFHACSDAACPIAADYRQDVAAHDWVDDENKTSVPATCTQKGVKYEKCSVCGLERETELDYASHTKDEGTEYTNSDNKTGKLYKCSVCEKNVRSEMDVTHCDNGELITDGKYFTVNKSYTWKFKLGEANADCGKLSFSVKIKKGASSVNLPEGYKLSSGEVEGTIADNFKGLRVGSTYSYSAITTVVGEITVAKLDANGEVAITLFVPDAADAAVPSFAGNVRIDVLN